MKKILLAILMCSATAWADIAVTPGTGKTVATTTDQGREFQTVTVSTVQVNNSAGVPTNVGYASGNTSVPISITSGSISNTGFNVTGSLPAGTNVLGFVNVNGTPTVQGIFSDNGAAAATNRETVLPSIYQNNYLNGTAATQGRNGALSQGTDGLLWTAVLPSLRPESFNASTGTIVPASNATYIAALCGNPTDLVLVYGLRVSCTETTAGNVGIAIVKTTATFTGAYSTMTTVADDSTMNVGASSATWFGVNPSNPATFGNYSNLDSYKLGCMATGTASPNDIYISPSDWKMKPVILRGVSQCVAVDLLSTTVTGGSFTATFDWMEVNTISP